VLVSIPNANHMIGVFVFCPKPPTSVWGYHPLGYLKYVQ